MSQSATVERDKHQHQLRAWAVCARVVTTWRTGRTRGAALAAGAILCASAEYGWCGWQTFTRYNGLGGNDVRAIAEDHSGNLWFATWGLSVSRYDGTSWRTFTTANGLAGNTQSILEDRAGNLWFGSMGAGVSRYDGTTWRTFTTADGLAGNNVHSILEDRVGNLWFGTDAGVSRYDGTTWRTFTTADGLANNQVWSFLEDRAGTLWVGTNWGVNRYDGATSTFTNVEGIASERVMSMCEDRSGNLWFVIWPVGVSRYDGASWQTFTTADGLVTNKVTSILEDLSGSLWVTTWGGGVSCYDGATWRTVTTADGLAANSTMCMLEDRSGNLWFGTTGGVSRYDLSDWETFTDAGHPRCSIEDRAGNLWFGGGDGVYRYDGATWDTLDLSDVRYMIEDRTGSLWFAHYPGVYRYNGATGRNFTTQDGLASNRVEVILEDRAGNLWFGTYDAGVSRYDGATWRTFTTADGLADNHVTCILQDRSGNFWFGSDAMNSNKGLSRYDGVTWRTFTTADGLADTRVHGIVEDRSGNLWFGTDAGVSRYDGATWRTFTIADGLAQRGVLAIVEDSFGNLWFGSAAGVSRYDGENWRILDKEQGLASNLVVFILEDRSGNLWFGTGGGLSRYQPDRLPPQTVLVRTPPRVSVGRDHAIVFGAFAESERIEFSYRVDAGLWSEWSSLNSAYLSNVADGSHVFEVRSRDFMVNTDETPARAVFEVDPVPPAPLIATPAFGQAVKARVEVRGTATDPRFVGYRLEAHPEGVLSWDPPDGVLLAESTTPVPGGLLGSWDTSTLPDGPYEVRLAVRDSLGLVGTAQVRVIVDNYAPFADVTAPAKITAAAGGDVYTTDAGVHLYFPPHGLAEDAVVSIAAVDTSSAPGELGPGVKRLLAGYEVDWSPVALRKPVTLEISYAAVEVPAGASPVLHHLNADSVWERLGGTADAEVKRIRVAVEEPGRYALYAETGTGMGTETLSALSFTPRVFSPQGTFANAEVGIGFTLGRSGAVTVKVYNRAGRLVRDVLSSQPLGAGANLVRWDGRDGSGTIVSGGLYLVSVEALGHRRTQTLAVVR